MLKPDELDFNELQAQSDEANRNKKLLGVAGNVIQGFENTPTAYELLYNKKLERPDTAGGLQKVAETIQDPWEKQKKTYEMYMAAKNSKKSDEADALAARKKDKMSPESMAARAYAKKIGMPVDDNMSADDLGDLTPVRNKMFEEGVSFRNQKALKQMEIGAQKDLALQKIREENVKKNSTPEKMRNLSGTDKARYDNALMVLNNIDKMGSALDRGDNTFSMIGDNDYTSASRNATEAYGRMQSGGAINKDEEARFEKALPGVNDAKEMQRQKLIAQRTEMLSRLKTLGFTPEEVGYHPKEFKYGSIDTGNNSASAGNKPKTVLQNGHTYTLNEQTGEYE